MGQGASFLALRHRLGKAEEMVAFEKSDFESRGELTGGLRQNFGSRRLDHGMRNPCALVRARCNAE